ncbi:hypothetical protein MAR_013913 [Mya arenaria]|uniref:BHLH domain-containing protein n=1 Tax=Mya arenaria TaxID=6604 RepID=A0ABY7G498_MYAAR|nr:hypothetical protein MAR_013913 [Mya arenaria]
MVIQSPALLVNRTPHLVCYLQVSSTTRVDKADILELTVFHLTRLQQRQRTVRVVTDATEGGSSTTSHQTGYRDCALGALSYLSANSHCSPAVATNLFSRVTIVPFNI